MAKDFTIPSIILAIDQLNINKRSKKKILKKFRLLTITIERNLDLFQVVIQMLLEEIPL